ncbi:hypothetical protein Nepgr_032736 [Nepenthes gracilis]|uniref:Secreted protein n=1 Tax=Nepenthes gracilis TaxID=150966 RepID=A0AAD3TL05_NEPGR|nr:hypothetical protein Nepgr_032736 [Nepenthes gracilis]
MTSLIVGLAAVAAVEAAGRVKFLRWWQVLSGWEEERRGGPLGKRAARRRAKHKAGEGRNIETLLLFGEEKETENGKCWQLQQREIYRITEADQHG